MRMNMIRVLVFGAVLAIAAIGIAGALGGDGDTRSASEIRAAPAAGQGPAAASGSDAATSAKRGKRGPRGHRGRKGERGPKGDTGPQGVAGAAGTDHVLDLSVNWREGNFSGRDSASTAIPGIGTLAITCNPSQQSLSLTPAQEGPRTVMSLTSFQGAGTFDNALNDRYTSTSPSSPIVINPTSFPINGMIAGTLSVELVAGDGGAGATPATLNLTSYLKVNDPTPANNYCYIAGQVIYKS